MANWAYIENNNIEGIYDNLPQNWRNISNFFTLETELDYLKTLGWYLIIKNNPNYNQETHCLTNYRVVFENNCVKEVWDIVDKPIINTTHTIIAQTEKYLLQIVQEKLDQFAQKHGYDNILSACSYHNDPNSKFQTESLYFIQIRSKTWTKLFEIIEEIKNGSRSAHIEYTQIQSELPILKLPE